MTSVARIAANRTNARKSTGPKTLAGETAAGKARVSRNARRHGLSRPIVCAGLYTPQVEALARPIGSETRAGRPALIFVTEGGSVPPEINVTGTGAPQDTTGWREQPDSIAARRSLTQSNSNLNSAKRRWPTAICEGKRQSHNLVLPLGHRIFPGTAKANQGKLQIEICLPLLLDISALIALSRAISSFSFAILSLNRATFASGTASPRRSAVSSCAM